MNFQRLESYKKAAAQACRYYGHRALRNVSLLCLSENATFLLAEDSRDKFRAVMRVARVGYHSRAEIEAELRWLEHLGKSDAVRAVYPVSNIRGNLLTQVEEERQVYVCVVFQYLEGHTLNPRQDLSAAADFRQTGRTAALLHRDAMDWKESGTLLRPHWNYENMVGTHGLFGNWRECRELDFRGYDTIDLACRRIRQRLENYGKNENNYGLIHADLRAANLLKDGSVLHVLDFDDCGFGWHLYDLAASVSFIEDDLRLGQWIGAWLEGYQSVLPLEKRDLLEIPTFIMARRIQLLAWLTSHEDSDPVKGQYPGFAGETVRLAGEYERYLLNHLHE
jgi:Ser/Thr protein kinase RdoA (MazF antagonist)